MKTLQNVSQAIERERSGGPLPTMTVQEHVTLLQASEMFHLQPVTEAALESVAAELKSVDAIWAYMESSQTAEGPTGDMLRALVRTAALENFAAFRAHPRWGQCIATEEGYRDLRNWVADALYARVDAHRQQFGNLGGYKGAEDALLWLVEDHTLENVQDVLPFPSIEAAVSCNLARVLTWYFNSSVWEGRSPWPLARSITMNRTATADKLLKNATPRAGTLEVLRPYLPEHALKQWVSRIHSSNHPLITYAGLGDLEAIEKVVLPNLDQQQLRTLLLHGTALAAAVQNERPDVVRKLLDLMRPDDRCTAIRQKSALFNAMFGASDTIWRLLLERPFEVSPGRSEVLADLSPTEKCRWLASVTNRTPHAVLREAAAGNHPDLVACLLDQPGCIDSLRSYVLRRAGGASRCGDLLKAIARGGHRALLERLLEGLGADGVGRVLADTNFDLVDGIAASGQGDVWQGFYEHISRLDQPGALERAHSSAVLWKLASNAPAQFLWLINEKGVELPPNMDGTIWHIRDVPRTKNAASTEAFQLLLDALPRKSLQREVGRGDVPLAQELKQGGCDDALIALLKTLGVTLSNLPKGVADTGDRGSPTLSPAVRAFLKTLLPEVPPNEIREEHLVDIALYGDASMLRTATRAYMENSGAQIAKLEADVQELQEELQKHERTIANLNEADSDERYEIAQARFQITAIEDEIVSSQRDIRYQSDLRKERVLEHFGDAHALSVAVKRSDIDTVEAIMAIAPGRSNYYAWVGRRDVERALRAASDGGYTAIYTALRTALPADFPGLTHDASDSLDTSILASNVADLLQSARDADDEALLTRYAEAGWRAYQREKKTPDPSVLRDLFVASKDYAVREAIFVAQKDTKDGTNALLKMAEKGDFLLYTHLEALNRDGAQKRLETMGAYQALQTLNVLGSTAATAPLASFGTSQPALVGATLVLKESLEKMAADQAARELLGIPLGATL